MALRLINPSRKPLLHMPRPFSSSSSSSNNNNPPFPPPPPPPSDDPGASPRHPPQNHGEGPQRPAASSIFGPPAPLSLDDMKRAIESLRDGSSRLSSVGGGAIPSFRDLLGNSAARPAGNPQGGAPIRKKKKEKKKGGAPNAGDAKPFAWNSICESIRRIDPQQQRQRQPGLPFPSSTPESIFGKEMRERAEKPQPGQGKEDEDDSIFLLNEYTYEELGQKLRELRPADAGKDGNEWFSLEELQGRIAKLAEQEKSLDPPFGAQSAFFRQTIRNLNKIHKKQKEQEKHVKTGDSA